MKVIAFAVLILSLTQAAQFKNPAFLGEKTVLAQVKNMMETGGPLEDIYGLFNGLVDEINAEQAEHDGLAAQQTVDCDEEKEFRAGEIADAEFARDRADNELGDCTAAKEKSERILGLNRDEQDRVEDQLANLHATREQEAALHEVRRGDHIGLDEAIDECIDLLEGLLNDEEPALLQIKESAMKLLTAGNKSRHAGVVAPAIMGLVQITQNHSDQLAVKSLINSFMNLKANSVQSWTDYEADEAAAIELYNTTVAALEADLAKLREDEATLVAHVADMNACIALQTATFNEAVNKLDRNTSLLGHATDTCADWFDKYESETASRAVELSLIGDVRSIVETRLNDMQGKAAARASEFEYEWDPYTNQYVYKAVAAPFESAETTFNAGGATGAGFDRDTSLEKFF